MYQLKALNSKDIARLDTVKITNQEEVKKATGQPLSLKEAYNAISEASAAFTRSDDEAEEADSLMYDLLERKGFFDSEAAAEPSENTPATTTTTGKITKEQLQKRLKAIEFLLRKATTDEQKRIREKAIKALNLLIKIQK